MNPQVLHSVRIDGPAVATIRREAARSYDGNETGGILLGQLNGDGTAEVRHAGDPGPVAVRQPTFFLRDLDHAQHLAAEAFAHDGSVWIGEWHTHPTTAPVPSDRDLDTYARLLADPELQFHVIVSVIIAAPDHRWDAPVAGAWACYPDRAEPVPVVVDDRRIAARTPLDGGQSVTEPRPAAGPHSRSGVRRFGDRYQDLIAWSAAMRIIQRGSPFHQLEIEVTGAGNVDDVILRSTTGRHRYAQVKWTTHPAELVDHEYLTTAPANGKSLLQKFYASWKLLNRDDQPPIMELVTNRALDRNDPLLCLVDGRTDLLNPAAHAAAATSAAGRRITEWAQHLDCERNELLDMLDGLVFKTGLNVSGEQDRAQTLMLANGLLGDADALDRGASVVTGWVLDGRRVISAEDITKEVERMRLHADDPRAVLLVQAINRDPNPEDATVALDWVHLYEGDSPPTRRQPRDPADWATMSNDIDRAVSQLAAEGLKDIVVRGAMRQATFFTIGARLAQVTGTTITYVQHGTPWPSNAPRKPVPAPQALITPVGAGNDLAVAVGMTVDPTTAVTRFISTAGLPVRHLLTLMPQEGAHDQSVAGPGEAVAYAQALRNAVREQLEAAPADRIHLFLAGPGGLALLLGHRWNRVAPTVVYEDLGPGRGYVPAFSVAA